MRTTEDGVACGMLEGLGTLLAAMVVVAAAPIVVAFLPGRVPQVVSGTLRDLRLENPLHDNFTALPLAREPAACPSNLTSWHPPRADLLDD